MSAWNPISGLGAEEARRFAGTARYSLKFDSPAPSAEGWWLDLARSLRQPHPRP